MLARNRPPQQGASVTPSTDGSGWRVTFFDADGFSGHANRETKEIAIYFALSEGYVAEDPQLLASLMVTERFRTGNEVSEAIHRPKFETRLAGI